MHILFTSSKKITMDYIYKFLLKYFLLLPSILINLKKTKFRIIDYFSDRSQKIMQSLN